MKEIEILFRLEESKVEALRKLSFLDSDGERLVIDSYYLHEGHPELCPTEEKMPREWLRVRHKGSKYYLTYKKDHLIGGKWQYSDEHESRVGSPDEVDKILSGLGFKPLVRVRNQKYAFKSENHEIVVEDVEDLGLFLEIEALDPSDDVQEERQKIKELVVQLGVNVSEELHQGKPEMLLEKKSFRKA